MRFTCKCTARSITFVYVDHTLSTALRRYAVVGAGVCGAGIVTAAECFAAATKALGATLAAHAVHRIVDERAGPSPRGCSVEREQAPLSATGPGRWTTEPNQMVVVFNTASEAAGTCGFGASAHYGSTHSLVNLTISLSNETKDATITMSGPADVWFGVGFGSSVMKGRCI